MEINEIKQRISNSIVESGISQNKIAKLIGVRQQSVNDFVKLKAAPALDTLAKICHVLDLDANYILGLCTFEGQKIEL